MTYVAGVDIGGTFTDCVVIDSDGNVAITKVPSTPTDFSHGVMAALEAAASDSGLEFRSFLDQTSVLCHGTTVATNVVVQRKGAKVGLISTAGHGDAIFMMRARGRVAGLPASDLLRFSAASKPDPIVPRHLVKEVHERIDCKGAVVVDVDEESVERAIRELVAEGVTAIAICLLWSFRNPSHEQRVAELIREIAPDIFVTMSSELVPRLGEYERTVATVLNAYVGPATSTYVTTLDRQARDAGLAGPFLIMQCNGGLAPANDARRAPLLLVHSGPTAGVIGSRYIGEHMDFADIIATDMGGTSFDVGLIRNGLPARATTGIISQYEYYVPNVDVQSIGAGGGSIAWHDQASDSIKVGPRSAGAEPGPVCYGGGNTEPTVTDADVVLGYINPDYFLGGRKALDRDAAQAAITALGKPLGLDAFETAAGIARLVDFSMADLIRKTTVEKGFDPRDFVIFAYGGAGPTHAGMYAREVGSKTLVIPLTDAAAVWSALGAASSDIVHIFEKQELLAAPFPADAIRSIIEELEGQALERLGDEGFSPDQVSLVWSADLRYRLQVHVVEVPLASSSADDATLAELVDSFEHSYESLYGQGTAYRAAGVELVTLRCTGRGQTPNPRLAAAGDAGARRKPPADSSRDVYWPDFASFKRTPIYDGQNLLSGDVVEGPAIIESAVTTIVVQPGQPAVVDRFGNIVVSLEDTA